MVGDERGAKYDEEDGKRRRRPTFPAHAIEYIGGPRRPWRVLIGSARPLLVGAGLASVAYLVAQTGVEALLDPLRVLSWRLAVFLVLPYAVVGLLHTVAWRLVFVHAPASLRRLFLIRLAGEALNLGTASVGGEPVKIYLLRPGVPLSEASAVQVVDKTAITIGQVLFLAVGLAVALPQFELAPDFVRAMFILFGVQIVAVIGFVRVQCVGIGGWTLRLLDRFGLATGERARGLAGFDRALALAYRERRGAVVGCVLVHLLGWLAGSLEVYLVLRWLGIGAPLTMALAIDAFGTGIKFLAFAIPGAIGVLEGGYMVVFGAFGLGGGLGLSFTLVRRLRMVVWSLVGLVVLAWLRAAPVVAGGPEMAPRPPVARGAPAKP